MKANERPSPPKSSKRVVITGVGGNLGRALAGAHLRLGWEVVGVSSQKPAKNAQPYRVITSPQKTAAHIKALLNLKPQRLILCAGAMEKEVGPGGLPLPGSLDEIMGINALFPARLALEAAHRFHENELEIVLIGSIADGSPSVFGPIYHASKSALHQFVSGTAPIICRANPKVRLRLYRPGVIAGDFSRAPMVRLGPRAMAIRERRCEGAPPAGEVAHDILTFLKGKATVGSDLAPLSFKLLQFWYGMFPSSYTAMQHWAWDHHSRWPKEKKQQGH